MRTTASVCDTLRRIMNRSLAEALAEITLPDVEGNHIQLGSLWESSPVMVVFLRHYG